MAKLHIESISISWSVSRGYETYGWNICRAVSRETGKTYRTTGGGYDMVGTVVGDWFTSEHQADLLALVHANLSDFEAYSNSGHLHNPKMSEVILHPDGSVYLEGGCGIECMLRIIEACGYEVQRQFNPRTKSKATTGYLISKVIGE